MTQPFGDAAEKLHARGWVRFPYDQGVATWLNHAIPPALHAIRDPENAGWLRCGGTWFAGVNVLPNDATGAVNGSGPLGGRVVRFLEALDLPVTRWDAAQISVIFPGYPRQSSDESDAAFRFRRDRDAAHVDGLLAIGPSKQRMLREAHAFVLGLPMNQSDDTASPIVVWDGSHHIIRKALAAVLTDHPPETWQDIDLTDAYHNARRDVFKTCRRMTVPAKPGEAYVIHRLALHGVAPWGETATAPDEGRMIAYFRPALTGNISDWIMSP